MLIKEDQLQPQINILEQLDQAVYLTQEEATISPTEITVKENSNIDGNTVLFEDVLRISSQFNCSLNEAIKKIAEANDIPSCLLAVDLKEDMAILYPEVVDEMYQVVISPMSENDPIGLWVESVIEEDMKKDYESLIMESTYDKMSNALIVGGLGSVAKGYLEKEQLFAKAKKDGGEYGVALGAFKDPNFIDNRQKVVEKILGGGSLSLLGASMKVGKGLANIDKVYDMYKNRPKTAIAKAIAKLRRVYSRLQSKLNSSAGDNTLKERIAKISSKILNTIDKLMRALQNAVN